MTVAVVFLAGALLLVGALRCWRPQPGWALGAAYVGLVAALFAPVIFGGRLQTPTDIASASSPWRDVAVVEGRQPHNPLLADGVLQMYPFRALVRARLLHGELPLWAHELGTGQPLLGNGQSAPFAPLNLLALPLPAIEEQSVIGPWKILTALLLMHALLAALGVGRAAAAFGAVAFALSPFNIAWLNHPHTSVSVWLPGVILGIFGLARAENAVARRRASAGTIVCGLAAALGGHPETLAHLALAAGAAVVLLAWTATGEARRRLWIDTAFAGVVIALLASPVLLPLVDAIPGSQRAAAVARNPLAAQPPEFGAARLATLVQPDAFGNPVSRSWRGEGNFNEISTAYAGLLTLGLALGGGALGRRAAVILALAASALAVAFHVWPWWDLWFRVPGIGHAANGRLRLLWVFAAALLGSLAIERVRVDGRARRFALAALLLVLGVAAVVPPASSDGIPRLAWFIALLSVAAALVALAIPRARRTFAAVCLIGLLAELSLPAARFQPAVARAVDLAPPAEIRALAPAAGGEPFRTLAMARTLAPNLGALDGLWDPRGNDPMRPAGATRVLAARLGPRPAPPPQSVSVRRLTDQRFLDALGVRFVLAPQRARLSGPWQPGFRWGSLRVWENPTPGRIFFIAPAVRDLAPAALAAASTREDLRTVTLRAGAAVEDARQDGQVDGVAWASNAFRVRLSARTPVLVASTVSFDRGWRAAIDGAPVRTAEVNGGFLGFSAPPGEHVAELRYRPRGWVWGCWLALGGTVLAGIGLSRTRDPVPAA